MLPNEIDTHFSKKLEHALEKANRQRIINEVAKVDGLIRNEKALKHMQFAFPEATSEPIEGLAPPRTNGIRCMIREEGGRACSYISC